MNRLAIHIAVACLLALPAAGQAPPQGPERPAPPPRDQAQPQPQLPQGQPPLDSAPPQPMPPLRELPTTRPPQPPPTTPGARKELTEEQEREITRNWNKALSNYSSIISGEDEARVGTLEKRIGANLALAKTHGQRLTKTQTELRTLKLTYARRYMVLKTSYQQGRLDKTTYVARLKELAGEYEFRAKTLTKDVGFYRAELATTRKRLTNLRQLHRINQMTLARRKPVVVKTPETQLERLLESIRAAGRFRVKQICSPKDCRGR